MLSNSTLGQSKNIKTLETENRSVFSSGQEWRKGTDFKEAQGKLVEL